MKTSLVKAIVAGATAASVTFAGAGIASAADDAANSELSSEFLGSSAEDGETTPDMIREYLSLFTSMIKAIETAFSFMSK